MRGHHLVCLHFFEGEGYNEQFVENLKRVVSSSKNSGVDVRSGADDICALCPYLDHSRCRYDEDAEEGIGEMDRVALSLLAVSPGATVTWKELGEKLPGIFPAWHQAFCTSCSWKRACEGNDLYRKLKERFFRPPQ